MDLVRVLRAYETACGCWGPVGPCVGVEGL